MDKDLRKIVKALEEQGFEVATTSKGHLMVLRNGEVIATFSGTPSDWRSIRNSLSRRGVNPMTEYNVIAELQLKLTEATVDELMAGLVDYHVSVGSSPAAAAEVTITVPADTLRQAMLTGLSVLSEHGEVTALEVLPTAEFDRRAGMVPVPPLASVTEAAAALGISRQAVLSRISSGSLPAKRVGSTFAIPRAAILM